MIYTHRLTMGLSQTTSDAAGLLQYGPLGVLVFQTLAFLGVLLKVLQIQREEREKALDMAREERREALATFATYAAEQRTTFLEHNRHLTEQCEKQMQSAIERAMTGQREWFAQFYRDVLRKPE